VSPHFGGEVWALHVMASSDNCPLAEWYVDDERHTGAAGGLRVTPVPLPNHGYLSLPDSPGLGVSIDWGECRDQDEGIWSWQT
jgi:L-alanine-DL-glutamate epimerase-like enolase superfamily enzyme